jgi:molecular chaperone GrpE
MEEGKNTNLEEMEVGLDLTENLEESTDSTYLRLVETEKMFGEMDAKYKLLYADFENYKKRAAKEKEELRNSVKASMLSSLLDIDSDLSLAVRSIKDESAKEGMQIIMGKLETFLKGHGVEAIQTEEYDEDLHEVISMMGEGKSVIDVISKGYTIGGKPFRYPKVILG